MKMYTFSKKQLSLSVLFGIVLNNFMNVESSILKDNQRITFGFPSAPGCHNHVAVVTITVPGFGVYGTCTGSLISPNLVVTAAHCCDINFELYATLGVQDLSLPSEPSRQEFVANYQYINPNYTGIQGNIHYSDVCLLLLNGSAVINNYVNTISLCSPVEDVNQDTYKYMTMRVSGIGGATARGASPSNVVNYFENWIVPNKMCAAIFNMYASMNVYQQYHLCTLNGPSSCFGDSGGPMTKQMYQNGIESHCLLGIVSFGLSSCGFASVCERLDTPNTQSWINNTIALNS